MTELQAAVTQFSISCIADVWDQAQPLIRAHHEEAGFLPASDFAPSKEQYLAMERAGMTRTFTCWVDGLLVGYAIFVVAKGHGQYPNILWARQDVLYVAPAHRGVTSVKFMEFQERALEVDGVHILVCFVAPGHDYSRTLTRQGFKLMERAYFKDLRKREAV